MKKKIDCLSRLFAVLDCRLELLEWLRGEKIITDDFMQNLLAEHHSSHACQIALLLNEMQDAEKLQIVDYTWTILPQELIKLSIVTLNARKDFTYSV